MAYGAAAVAVCAYAKLTGGLERRRLVPNHDELMLYIIDTAAFASLSPSFVRCSSLDVYGSLGLHMMQLGDGIRQT